MHRKKPNNDERARALCALHADGWSNEAMARVLHMSTATVARWMCRLELTPNRSKFAAKIDDVEAVELYRTGASDSEIAKRFGADTSGVCRWRQRRGLERNFDPNPPLDRHVARSARKMLADGASRRQVADAHDIACLGTVQKLRRGMDKRGLRPTGLTNASIRARVLKDKTLMPRIVRAVGKSLPPDVKHDAVSGLYLAVLEGLIRSDLIEQKAPKFRAKAFALNGDGYGQRSLDDDAAGWSMLDRLEDPNAIAAFDRISF